MSSGDVPEVPNSVKEARERFDLFSDASLASRLQDQEFGAHFHANRQERRLVGSDTKVSRVEQMNEMQRQAALRREHLTRVAETDEEIARRLQEEFNREEEVKRFLAQKQADDDARIARELQQQEQGRIVGYGPSSVASPSTSATSASSSSRRSTDTHHIYSAQNNLNEHYADRASTSLIDLSAQDALATLPSPPAFGSNPDLLLPLVENRVSAYAPSAAVPLLPPPPEFVVRREQERVMEELSRLQPRLALAGMAAGDAAAAAAYVSPPPAYSSPPLYSSSHSAPPAAPFYPSLPSAAAATPSYSSPPSTEAGGSFYSPAPPAAPVVTVTTPTPTGVTLADTNPFLVDLMGGERNERSSTVGATGYFSEFGLPPPSSLATGDQRGDYSHSLI